MASMAGLVLETEARILDDHWEVSIRSVYGYTQPVLAHGRNTDLISAARIAADRMAVLLGYSPTPGADVMPGQSRLDETLHQIEAYLLAERLDKARALIDKVDPADMQDPTLRLHRATTLSRSGDYQQAAEELEVLSTEIDPKERPLIYARVLNALASTYQSRADYPSSEQYRTQAIVVLERLDSFEARNTLGHALGMRGATHARMGNLEQAQSDFARARIYLEATGDQLGLARLDGNLAVLYVNLEQLTNALPPAQRAIERLRLFGEVTSELRARTVLTHLYMMMLEPDKALEQLRQLEPLLDQISNPALIRVIDIYRIEVLLANGLIDEGTQKIVAATAEIEAAEGVNRGNWPQAIAARHAFESGDLSRAIEQASMAVHKPWDPALAARHAQTWLTLIRAQLASGQFDEATTTSTDALAWADREDGLAVGVYILLLQAEYAAAHALPERAVTLFDQALRLADRRGIPIELFHVVESYAEFLIDQGRLDEAGIIAGRVSGWADSHYGTALLQLRLYHALDNPTAWRLALARVNSLAGERRIPEELQMLSASRSRLTMAGQ